MATVAISTEYITLGQFLKEVSVIDSGGQAKWFLQENQVAINGEVDTRRGRKLRAGDVVTLPDGTTVDITAE